jgi:putative SOS response-associated peptidase YedK
MTFYPERLKYKYADQQGKCDGKYDGFYPTPDFFHEGTAFPYKLFYSLRVKRPVCFIIGEKYMKQFFFRPMFSYDRKREECKMCGRFTIISDPAKLMEWFHLDEIPFDFQPRYNVAPGQFIPAIIADGARRRIGQLRWGLVPSWAKDEKIGYSMINARAETLSEKPAFKNLFARKRCVIPADSFYEWKSTGKGKQPMRITMKDGSLFAFAGLFDTWIRPDGGKLHTCTIITTRPNELVAEIHDRMPVILHAEDESIWLDRERFDPDLLQSLLTPYEASRMRAYPVSAIVGNAKNDLPECIEEVSAWP